MAIIKCPECGHQVSDKAATCPSCGIEIAGRVVKCPECGAVVFKDHDLCPNCHKPLHSDLTAAESESNDGVTAAQKGRNDEMALAERHDVSATGANLDANKASKPRKKGYIALVVVVAVLLAAGFVAAYFYKSSQENREAEAYAKAMLSDQPSVLQNYLDIYQEAPAAHRDSIEAHLQLLMNIDKEWTDAVVSGSKAAIERYMKLYPNSPHALEARIRIDSLDWVAATNANTAEALTAYMEAHADGLYYDEAKDKFNQIEAQQVSDDDRETITSLFVGYFKALADNDEDGLTANLANILDSFLQKPNATKNDVVTYMHKLHSDAGQSPLEFRTNNDWKIKKEQSADGVGYDYVVDFSVDEKKQGIDDTATSIVTYKVNATVSAEGKISSLNMKRMVQE